jgi:hypothetical protein
MKMLKQVCSTTGSQRDDVISMPKKMNPSSNGVKWESHDSMIEPSKIKFVNQVKMTLEFWRI